MSSSNRRDFLTSLVGAAGALAPTLSVAAERRDAVSATDGRPPAPVTVQKVIDIIIESIPGGALAETVDTVKAGEASRPVTGIVTTFLATSEVIKEAADRGANFIITHEPTFYNHLDAVDWLAGDPVYEAKRKLLADAGLVVWRFHDYWHRHRPDGVMAGVLEKLGWESRAVEGEMNVVEIPEAALSVVTAELKRGFGTRTLRVVGDPSMTCARIGLMPGAAGGRSQIDLVSRSDIDVLVVGEVREWETTEYVRDANSAGIPKALVSVGHAPSEEPGMEWLVDWLRPKVPGVSVVHVAAGDPFHYL